MVSGAVACFGANAVGQLGAVEVDRAAACLDLADASPEPDEARARCAAAESDHAPVVVRGAAAWSRR